MFAKQHNGKFILRIEDLHYDDTTSEQSQDVLQWAGLPWDEGPDSDKSYC